MKTSEYIFPASFSQRAYWFLHQLQPELPSYNVPIGLQFTGFIDLAAMEQAFVLILNRHEALRTTFRMEGTS